MSIFAIMHIFAFPWKPYSLKHGSKDHMDGPGTSYSAGMKQPRYQGGPLGLWALGEAFNPWDIMKMTARSFRWLFVGVRYRHHDISYQTAKEGDGLGWDGTRGVIPTAASLTELNGRGGNGPAESVGTAETVGTADDDHAALLPEQRIPR